MAGRIPESLIDELMSRVDLVEVIDARVPLRKAGREFVACCPFHTEKTPSFTVSPEKQFYHCFGCGAHGTALGFLMEYEHLGFVEAVEELAAQVGLSTPKENMQSSPDGTGDLYRLLAEAADFYRRQLGNHRDARRAVSYLKHRGLDGPAAAEFGIGFAPPGWDNLLRALGANETARKGLISAGLLTEKEGQAGYDRFRDRIMFPIRDRRGRVAGFGGRVLGEGEPKYLNSPETPVFHKGRELYGLYEARQASRHIERLLIVEGYMDVVALAQFGVRYAVATLGTATTPQHLEAAFRVAPEVVFCFDGDQAGRKAAWKALVTVLPVLQDGREARFLLLPEGEDPDSLVRSEGRETFEVRVANARPLSEFFFDRLATEVDLRHLDGRARLVELVRPHLARLPRGVFRHLMIERLAEIVHMQPERLEVELKGPPQAANPQRVARPVGQGQLTVVSKAIGLLIQNPRLAACATSLIDKPDLAIPGVPLLMELLELLQVRPNLTTGALLERWRDTNEGRHLEKLAAWPLGIPENGLDAEFAGLVLRLGERFRERRAERLLARAETLSDAEKRELSQLLSRSGDMPGV